MKVPLLQSACSLLLVLALTGLPAFALWGYYPNDTPVNGDGWPPSIVKAINSQRRVYGAGAWDIGWSFYFVGNTDDANRFLAQVAQANDAVLDVVLVPDAGTANVQYEPMGKASKIDYAWSLYLRPYRERAWIAPKDDEPQEQFQKRLEQERAKLPEFAATVTVHCGGSIDPAALKLPLRLHASVGGRLANLADYHNARIGAIQKSGERDGQPPTDMQAAEAPRAVFAAPATQPAAK